ncbi:MAG: hypothetical protein H0W84_05215 [Bacteroidetes bacterium]|nr:hypothetical protein [Bacteroidota bacterium]
MKKIVMYFLFYSFIIFSCINANAQSNSVVRIYDLNPGTETDSTTSQAKKVKMFVNFKIVNVDKADSVFFLFGNTPGGSETTKELGQFNKLGSDYVVKTQGPSYPIINNEASCRVKISMSDYYNSSYLSLVVKDKSGLFTNVLNIRIN